MRPPFQRSKQDISFEFVILIDWFSFVQNLAFFYTDFPPERDIALEITECELASFYENKRRELKELNITSVNTVIFDYLFISGLVNRIGHIRIEHVMKLEISPSAWGDLVAEDILFNNVTFSELSSLNPVQVKDLTFNNTNFLDVRGMNIGNVQSSLQSVTFSHCLWQGAVLNVLINSSSFVMDNNIFKNLKTQPIFNIASPTVTLIHRQSDNASSSCERRIGLGYRFNQTYSNVESAAEILNTTIDSTTIKWLSNFNLVGNDESESGNCTCEMIETGNSWVQSIICPDWSILKQSISDQEWQVKNCYEPVPDVTPAMDVIIVTDFETAFDVTPVLNVTIASNVSGFSDVTLVTDVNQETDDELDYENELGTVSTDVTLRTSFVRGSGDSSSNRSEYSLLTFVILLSISCLA